MIPFIQIPSTNLVPGVGVELDLAAGASLAIFNKTLVFGPVLAADLDASITHDQVVALGSDLESRYFGEGSILTDMVRSVRKNNPGAEIHAVALDPTGTTAATGDITIGGAATEAGQLVVYIGMRRYVVTVASGDAATVVSAALAAEINADTAAFVAAVDAAGTITLTDKTGGVLGNSISIAVNYGGLFAGEQTPAGLTTAITPMSGGVGAPAYTNALLALGNDAYDFWIYPDSDSVTLDEIATALDANTGRWSWTERLYGIGFTAKDDTWTNLTAFGPTRNEFNMSVMGITGSPSPIWQIAAAYGGQAGLFFSSRPARSIWRSALLGIEPPKPTDQFDHAERQGLYQAGIAGTIAEAGVLRIDRPVTTATLTSVGLPTDNWRDINNAATTMTVLRYIEAEVMEVMVGRTLVDDGETIPLGDIRINATMIRTKVLGALQDLVDNGHLERISVMNQTLRVERSATDPTRVDMYVELDLANPLYQLNAFVVARDQID